MQRCCTYQGDTSDCSECQLDGDDCGMIEKYNKKFKANPVGVLKEKIEFQIDVIGYIQSDIQNLTNEEKEDYPGIADCLKNSLDNAVYKCKCIEEELHYYEMNGVD